MLNPRNIFNESKWLFAIITVIVIGIVVCAVDVIKIDGPSEKYQISVIVDESNSARWDSFQTGLRQAARENGIRLNYVTTDFEGSPVKEKNLIDQEIENGADAVIVQLCSGSSASDILTDIPQNVYIELIDNNVDKDEIASSKLGYTGADSVEVGTELATRIIEEYGELKGVRIGILAGNLKLVSVQERVDSFKEKANEAGAQIVFSVEATQISEREIGELVKSNKADILVALDNDVTETAADYVKMVDRTEPEHIIDMALKYDVPVIFFNRELTKEDLQRSAKFYYVGSDAVESGIMQGELAADEILGQESTIDTNNDGTIQYVMLQGEAGHQDAIVRSEYCVETLINKGVQLDRQGLAIANFNRTQAQSKIEQLISSNTEIELILANNDDMALGAIDAYLNMYGEDAKSKIPAIYGIDGTIGGLEAVKTGYMHGTVYNDKEGQAHAMYDLAMALATGSSLDGLGIEDGHYIRLPHTKITLDNVNDFLYR